MINVYIVKIRGLFLYWDVHTCWLMVKGVLLMLAYHVHLYKTPVFFLINSSAYSVNKNV